MVTHDQSLAPRFSRTLGIADGELEVIVRSDNGILEEGLDERVSL
jgi:hypothetical protein